MKKIILAMLLITCGIVTAAKHRCHHNRGKDFGVTFGATALGSAVGTAVGNVISQPAPCHGPGCKEVVVVKEIHEVPAKVRRRERLENQLRNEIEDLRLREDELTRELKRVRIALEDKERTLRRIKASDADVEIVI